MATGGLLKPEVWAEATENPIPFVFAGNYNGPGTWRYGLGFVESGGFIGGEGSFAGYESTTMCSPTRRTAIEVVSTKNPNAITLPPCSRLSPWQSTSLGGYDTAPLPMGLTDRHAEIRSPARSQPMSMCRNPSVGPLTDVDRRREFSTLPTSVFGIRG
ncbi:hypothetical protein [Streptomyces sp. NPDC057889]|uniref:hypothetical protein n=1 Tax=unclassified Streptomyces TaxID=2593676 RepID=UPI003678DEDD